MKQIHITECQKLKLFKVKSGLITENISDEGFDFRDGEVKFTPIKQKNADTTIFNKDKEFNVKRVLLPKSNVMSYNLYNIYNMKPNKALKHKKDINGNNITWYNGENYSNTIDFFLQRSALYIKHLIGKNKVDYLTCPQSSSEFNKIMLQRLRNYFPNSKGIVLKPDMLVKNVNGLYINVGVAKSLGLTSNEIHTLQRRVELWKHDEKVRNIRRKIEVLKQEIANVVANRKRGRPSREFTQKQDLLKNYENEIKILRQGRRGRDATIDKDGKVKTWQIKSLDDKDRKALEGLFTINPEYNGIQQYLKGKSVIIFDDNISSGATLDDFCLKLKELGVENIMAFTLGVIEPTIYKTSERMRQ